AITRDYERALSPIRRLPAEVLIEIFRWTCVCCNTYNPYHLSGFNVFEVCGSWRNMVTTVCSELWSRFIIKIPCKMVTEDDCEEEVIRYRPVMKRNMRGALIFLSTIIGLRISMSIGMRMRTTRTMSYPIASICCWSCLAIFFQTSP
ncbi:hypothetical protein EV421DRAFT_1808870, partial [Armillaria borealis]